MNSGGENPVLRKYRLLHPEFCQIAGPGGAITCGADQDWFPTFWQREAGCGPTAAAVVFAYLAQAHPELRPLCPQDIKERAAFTALMCRVWDYITPGIYGLNRPEVMRDGMACYGKAQGILLSPVLLEIPAAPTKRPCLETVCRFIGESLTRECPVVFLNLHNGKVRELDRWHWVTITALDGVQAEILDSGRSLNIDLALWLATTRRRGGFVSALGEKR